MIDNNCFKCCKGCSTRAVGCHSTCAAYADAKADYAKIREVEEKEKIADDVAVQRKNRMSAYRYYMQKRGSIWHQM